MKEMVQTITKDGDQDDFMGFTTIPLSAIKFGHQEKWLTLSSNQAIEVCLVGFYNFIKDLFNFSEFLAK